MNTNPKTRGKELLKPATLEALRKSIPAKLAAGEKVKKLLRDGGNLCFAISATGATSWVFVYDFGGKRRTMGLGRYPDVSLKDAREKAAAARVKLVGGIDPLEEKQQAVATIQVQAQAAQARTGLNYEALLERHIAQHRIGHTDANWETELRSRIARYVLPFFKARPAEEWTYETALAVLEQPVQDEGGHPGKLWIVKHPTAKRIMDNMLLMLKSASATKGWTGESRDYWEARFENDLPAAKLVKTSTNHPALPYRRMPEFVQTLREYDNNISLYLEFLILTIGPRSGPTLAATWDQMRYEDTDSPVWTVPRESMGEGGDRVPGMKAQKNQLKEDFVVPLVPRAVEILRVMAKRRCNKYVFPGRQIASCLARGTVIDFIERMNRDALAAGRPAPWVDPKMEDARIVPHGFRASFKTYFEEVKPQGYDRDAVEFCMGHVKGDRYGGAYYRPDMVQARRAHLEIWAAHCEPKVSAEVIQLNRATLRTDGPVPFEDMDADTLTRLVWSKSTVKAAAELGISDVALGKRCKRLGVEKPPAGFWRKVETGLLPHPQGIPMTAESNDERRVAA